MKAFIIEKDKLQKNIDIIKGLAKCPTIIAVLKGNAYGLGLSQMARVLLDNHIDFFAVSELEEGVALRQCGFTNKILLMSPTSVENEIETIIQHGLIPTVGTDESGSVLNKLAKKADVMLQAHLKIDTGFGRYGFLHENLAGMSQLVKSFDNVNITGTFSHFSFAFASNAKLVQKQFEYFLECVKTLNDNGVNTGILHIANSCAFLRFDNMHLDAVRIGSAFLGRIPIENIYGLEKIGFLKSRITETKFLPKGHPVGYANTFITKKKTRIAIVPVGYNDGFGVERSKDTYRFLDVLRYMFNDLKCLGKNLTVSIKGRDAKILGRISMFNIVVDITEIKADIGDDVIIQVNPLFVRTYIPREFI